MKVRDDNDKQIYECHADSDDGDYCYLISKTGKIRRVSFLYVMFECTKIGETNG